MRIELTVSLPIFHAKDDLEESVHELEKLLVAYCWIPFTIRMTAYKPSVDIVELPGKGLGVLAKKDFEPGQCIVAEQPLFVLAFDLKQDWKNLETMRKLIGPELEETLEGMTDKQREDFYRHAQHCHICLRVKSFP